MSNEQDQIEQRLERLWAGGVKLATELAQVEHERDIAWMVLERIQNKVSCINITNARLSDESVKKIQGFLEQSGCIGKADEEKVRASETGKYRPKFDEDGVPWCDRNCPMYMMVTKQCEILQRRPRSVCLPWMQNTLGQAGVPFRQVERER